MSILPRPAKGSDSPALALARPAPRPLAVASTIARALVERYWEARRCAAESEGQGADDLESIAWHAADDAEHAVLRAALALGSPTQVFTPYQLEKVMARPSGFLLDGTLYLALPRPDNEGMPPGAKDEHNCDVMALFVVDASAIVALDGKAVAP